MLSSHFAAPKDFVWFVPLQIKKWTPLACLPVPIFPLKRPLEKCSEKAVQHDKAMAADELCEYIFASQSLDVQPHLQNK